MLDLADLPAEQYTSTPNDQTKKPNRGIFVTNFLGLVLGKSAATDARAI